MEVEFPDRFNPPPRPIIAVGRIKWGPPKTQEVHAYGPSDIAGIIERLDSHFRRLDALEFRVKALEVLTNSLLTPMPKASMRRTNKTKKKGSRHKKANDNRK